jgi:excinuclease ABC subunit A
LNIFILWNTKNIGVIDLGLEAGDGGGELIFAGKPADLKKVKESYTARYL